jgi:CRISPR system Cascade subunit CasA
MLKMQHLNKKGPATPEVPRIDAYIMNLLTEKWIPILRNGQAELIAPFEIGDQSIEALNAPRPDFQGALAQFLIGLLQTVLPDLKSRQWQEWYKTPPSAETLKTLFEPLKLAFELEGTPAFMQDYDLKEAEAKPIAALLIDQPGQQALEQNTDHFIKRGTINQLCQSCTATALFTLQINAPSGGAGHRTSLRGGGPLTTLIFSDRNEHKNLWQMLWLNVMTIKTFREQVKISGDERPDFDNKKIFPWLASTRTSEKASKTEFTYLLEVHPFQMYWCMPRRICLDFEKTTSGVCDICGKQEVRLLTQYVTKNYGINYSGSWQHPLSPYRKDKKTNEIICLHPQSGGFGYKDWEAMVLESDDNHRYSAPVIRAWQARADESNDLDCLKIWIFGYDMDNMKARCWYESTMPFYHVEALTQFKNFLVKPFLKSAEEIRYALYLSLKIAKGIKKKIPKLKEAEYEFWHKTELKFHELVKQGLVNLRLNPFSELKKEKLIWLAHLKKQANFIFYQHADIAHPSIHGMIKFELAKGKLKSMIGSKKILNILGLTKEEVKNGNQNR